MYFHFSQMELSGLEITFRTLHINMFASGFLRTSRRVFPFPWVNFAIVGGGGGGGRGNSGTGAGGGGGGGAVLISTFQVSLSTPYLAAVGVGGVVSTLAGNSSVFGYTAAGGGNGGDNNIVGSNGGCGGGGGLGAGGGSDRAGGTGIAPYGFNGASSRGTIFNPNPALASFGGGGGGAGEAAIDPINSPYVNNGGNGLGVRIGNTLYQTFGGGGGGGIGYGNSSTVGGAGGVGGGGAGGGAYPANGTVNTGGGGGGQGGAIFSGFNTPSTGGTGVVLIWYAGASRGTIQSGTGTTTTFNSNTVHTLTSNAQIIFA